MSTKHWAANTSEHRRRVLFSPGGGEGLGAYTDTGKLGRGWEHCKLHVFVQKYLLKVYMTT